MKKLLLLFVLLPFLGFSQIDLARWNGNPNSANPSGATTLANYIEASNVGGLNVNYANGWNGSETSNWTAGNALLNADTKYFQFSLHPTAGVTASVSQITFTYQGNYKQFQVRYSKVADFSTFTTALTQTGAVSNNNNADVTIPVSISVLPTERLYVRIFAYDSGSGTWLIKTPAVRGTLSSPSPLSGTYTVGAATTNSYATLTAAVSDLNAVGVSAAVTFLLNDATYSRASYESFPLIITPYTGNTTYKVTFRPNTGVTATIESTNSPSSQSTPAVFKLNGVDNVVFDGSNNGTTTNNLTIYNNNPLNPEKAVIWIASQNSSNGANSNEIKNLTLKQYYRDDAVSAGVFSGSTGTATSINKDNTAETANSNNTVKNVTFTKVGQAVYVNGNASSLSAGWKIQGNTIGGTTAADKPFLGVYLNNAKDYEVSDNSIIGVLKNTTGYAPLHSGIIISGSSNGSIFNNIIRDVYQSVTNTYCAGIYLDSGNNIVYNNMISNISNNSTDDSANNMNLRGHGIYVNSGASNKLYYNTIYMNATGNAYRGSAVYVGGGTALDIKNNIFYNAQTSGSNQFAFYSAVAASQLTTDYNAFIAPTTTSIYNNGTAVTLATWKSAGKDTHSILVAPAFVTTSTTATNLHVTGTNSGFDNLGSPIASITTDIDAESRSTTTPDMGADEFGCNIEGDQVTYGAGSWIGYVYDNTSVTPSASPTSGFLSANYKGYNTQSENFDQNVGGTGISGSHICGTYTEKFAMRFKMTKTYTAGQYNIVVGGDDGYRLSIDGGATWIINNWADHDYTTTAVQVTLSGTKNLVLEYYQNPSTSHVSFSCGLIVGDPTVYGDNVWNVYGFNSTDINPASSTYAGYYSQATLGINTQDTANNGWDKAGTPSSSAGWGGAPVGIDNFVLIHKRKGFPCGRYIIKMEEWDDAGELYLNGTKIWSNSSYSNGGNPAVVVGTYALGAATTMEVRLKENGGDAKIKMTLTDVPVTYNGTWSGTQAGSNVQIDSDLSLSSDLSVCSCTVSPGKTLTVSSNTTLTVEDYVKVKPTGSLIVEDDANLIQINDNSVNSGIIKVKRETTPLMQYDYTYWSAPVSGAALSTVANSGPSIFYKFDVPSNNWTYMSDSSIMQVGQGYISRAPNNLNFTTVPRPTVLVTFSGLQNSGVINTPVVKSTGSNYNLIGNPYPSALDAKQFITANQTKINGTIYFWTHKTAIAYNNPNGGSGTYNYSADDYAKYNLTGGTSTGTASTGSAHSDIPTGKIASGQAFFVEASNTGTANVSFNNAMRTGGTNSNNQFFRTANPETASVGGGVANEGRVWLNMTNPQGAYSEILLGYVDGATNGLDNLYDGKTMDAGNYIALYSILDQDNLSIQGKGLPFANTDVVSLGFNSSIAESFTIAINNVDGFFGNTNQNVYLVDKLLNVTTNLKQGGYTFSTEIGVFNNRFELRFADATLGVDVPTIDKNDIAIIRSGNQIHVNSTKESISGVMVYDLLGKVVYQKSGINSNTFSSSDLNVHDQVVIVKVQTENKLEMVKKVIMN